MEIAGRKDEIQVLQKQLTKPDSSFVALYGRRRVGKTYLIRQVYAKHIVFECSGLHQRDLTQQLENFWLSLAATEPAQRDVLPPKTWLQAFDQLRTYLNRLPAGKKVVFLDEIAWFDTPRSGFLAALDAFWNQFCTKRIDIILVICGSAASWIIDKVINSRGGLHNRLTTHMRLLPFTLSETKTFFAMNHVALTLKDIAQLYMCVGGIPFYLSDLEAGKSVPQLLDELFFGTQGRLRHEFQNLYAALFKNNALHEAIVKALATKSKGLTRSELIKTAQLKSGGGLTTALNELIACGFIRQMPSAQKQKEDALYQLIDEYTIFYFRFLDKRPPASWLQLSASAAYKSWSGYAFESLCLKHTAQIKKALGISGIITQEYGWSFAGTDTQKGTQIDLIIDRADNCINLFELKFYDTEFELTKAYAEQLRQKIALFKQHTRTRKNVFLTLLTAYGANKNAHYLSTVTNQLTLEDLFD
jgi:uncharacterized protein